MKIQAPWMFAGLMFLAFTAGILKHYVNQPPAWGIEYLGIITMATTTFTAGVLCLLFSIESGDGD